MLYVIYNPRLHVILNQYQRLHTECYRPVQFSNTVEHFNIFILTIPV